MANKSEFAGLSDLAISKGASYSSLISEIHDRVLLEYRKLHPDGPKTVDVVVDAKTGEVRLMRDKEDVTPDSFVHVAEKIAREVVIEKLDEPGSTHAHSKYKSIDLEEKYEKYKKEAPIKERKPSELSKWIVNFIFWGYNLIYLLVVAVFLGNLAFKVGYREEFMQELIATGFFRGSFLLTAGLVPLITVYAAMKYKAKIKTEQLATLFFLFEVPLVVTSIFFANALTSPTPIMWIMFVMIIFAIPVFLINLLKINVQSEKMGMVALFLRESLFLTSFYIALLFSFFVPLILGSLVKIIFDFISDDIIRAATSSYRSINPFEVLLAFIFGGLGISIILALTSLPYLIAFQLGKIFTNSKKSLTGHFGNEQIKTYTYVFGAVWFLLVFATSYQPSPDKYIERLEALGTAETFEEKEEIAKELLTKESQIKKAFENIKNVRRRYLMAKSDDYIKDAYEDVFNSDSMAFDMIQDTFATVAYPFVYQGSLDRNYEAQNSFDYLFGKYYQKSTAQAAKSVNLLSRKVDVKTSNNDLIASITIDEKYTNTTIQDQEIIYEFFLPGDAVITDLNLGPDLEFPGIIAPKGAARETYERQIVRRRDPALLEQTGPSQYRLRVYPIPSRNDRTTLSGKNQRVSFTYQTALTQKGFAMPIYTKEQNIKTADSYQENYINNSSAQIKDNYIQNNLTKAAADKLCTNKDNISLQSEFASTSAYLIPNITLRGISSGFNCDSEKGLDLLGSAQDLDFAILFDVSYKNKDNEVVGEAKKLLEDNKEILAKNNIDIYKANDLVIGPLSLESDTFNETLDLTFFGHGNWTDVVNKIEKDYDFIILVTNSSTPQTTKSTNINKNTPLYIVHNDTIPTYTTNLATDILQSGGYSTNSFRKAINKAIIDATKDLHNNMQFIGSGDYFSYFADKTNPSLYFIPDWSNVRFTNESDPASYLFAKSFLDGVYETTSESLNKQVNFLDLIHGFSVNNSVIGPHSSLIALVNETQLRTLENLSQNLDRYEDAATRAAPVTDTFNLRPSGFSAPSGGGLNLFGSLSMEKSQGGAVGDAMMGAPMGVTALGGGGGGMTAFFGISLFVVANGVIVGLGVLVLLIVKVVKSRKAKK